MRDRRGASAVEFAIVSLPFVLVLLMILQMGIYYMTQASLDTGVIQAADSLVNQFYSTTGTYTAPTPASLKTSIISKSGGLITATSLTAADLRLLTTLDTAVIPVGNIVDPSVARSVLVLRAQANVVTFMPGFASLSVVRSSALVRRQGF